MSKDIPRGFKVRDVDLGDPTFAIEGRVTCVVKGTTSLIVNRFSEKVKNDIVRKHKGEKLEKRPKKDPEQNMLDALHVIGARPQKGDDLSNFRYGVPANCIKAAMIRASQMSDMKMAQAKTWFFVEPDDNPEGLIELSAGAPTMREDIVRNQTGVIDVRHRPEFQEWGLTINIRYHSRMLSAEQVAKMLQDALAFVGILEWRPGGTKTSGIHGCGEVLAVRAMEPVEVEEDKPKKKAASKKAAKKATKKKAG